MKLPYSAPSPLQGFITINFTRGILAPGDFRGVETAAENRVKNSQHITLHHSASQSGYARKKLAAAFPSRDAASPSRIDVRPHSQPLAQAA
jgi:hypothetical protein